jgi:hypothetical protein
MATSEYLLHYVWKYRIFDRTDLQTVDGEPLEIIDPGVRNSDAGADFFNAKIRIGEKIGLATWSCMALPTNGPGMVTIPTSVSTRLSCMWRRG